MILVHNIKWEGFDYEKPLPKNQLKDFNKLPTDYLLLDYPTPTDSYFCNLYVKGVLITQYNWRPSTFDITPLEDRYIIVENPTKGG
jgi:hypothetical protein